MQRLRAVEIATTLVSGEEPETPPLPQVEPGLHPKQALEEAIRPALERSPCVVSFSGGRDSSAVLAIATRLARAEGLELPVPSTLRFPGNQQAQESEWQEAVMEHLGLPDWERRTIDDELDWVGPVAQRVLLRHGILFPPNAFVHLPLIESAKGGSLLTGVDGDGLFSPGPWGRVLAVVGGSARPQPRDVLRVGFALAPLEVKVRIELRRHPLRFVWLSLAPGKQFERELLTETLSQPLLWHRAVHWWWRRRSVALTLDSFRLLGESVGTCVTHPLAESRFLAAVSARGGWKGFPDRTSAMSALFGDVLPESVLSRLTKASLETVFWNNWSRELAAGWSGGGVPPDIVDEKALRSVWDESLPDARTAMLLQAVWLSRFGDKHRR